MPSRQWVSTRRPGSSGTAKCVTRPGLGAKSRAGSSATRRHSTACPAKADVLLAEAERLAVGEAQLQSDEVKAA